MTTVESIIEKIQNATGTIKTIVLLEVIISIICCTLIAKEKGRGIIGWFFVGLFWGFTGILCAVCASDLNIEEEVLRMEQQQIKTKKELEEYIDQEVEKRMAEKLQEMQQQNENDKQ